MRRIIGQVATYFEIPPEVLTNMEWRDRETMEARRLAAWLILENFPNAQLKTISRVLGYRERSGASHAVAVLEKKLADPNAQVHKDIRLLRELVAA